MEAKNMQLPLTTTKIINSSPARTKTASDRIHHSHTPIATIKGHIEKYKLSNGTKIIYCHNNNGIQPANGVKKVKDATDGQRSHHHSHHNQSNDIRSGANGQANQHKNHQSSITNNSPEKAFNTNDRSATSRQTNLMKVSGHEKNSKKGNFNRNIINNLRGDNYFKTNGETNEKANSSSGNNTIQQIKQADKEQIKNNGHQARNSCMKSTLNVLNILALISGVSGMFLASLLDDQFIAQIQTSRIELGLAAIYLVVVALIGLYGVRCHSSQLLVTYGLLVIAVLFMRSITCLVNVTISSTLTAYSVSMIIAFIEILAVIFAFAMASNIRNSKHSPNHSKLEV